MYILTAKIKNDLYLIRNSEYRDLGNNTFMRKYLKKGQLKYNPSSVKEWCNSIYNLEKNKYEKTLPFKDKLIYELFNTYFNINESKKYDDLSMGRIFIGKPEVKHFNNKIYINLYMFNKWITRFYKMTNVVKTAKILFSQENKRSIENRPFLMGTLLLKYPKFDQKLIIFTKKFLVRTFNNNNNKMFIKMLYTNVVNFFDKTELYKLLGLRKDTDIYTEKLLFNKHGPDRKIKVINKNIFKMSRLDKRTKRCLFLYLYLVNYFFYSIGFSKLVNILGKALLCNSKEKRTNCLKIILERLGKIYFTVLKINSLHLLIRLIYLFLMLKKILKSIYIMKWYMRNIFYDKYKFNIKSILVIKNILNKLYNNKVEINIVSLKYLHLDGNILALAVVRKLKNRNRRILKVIRMALRLSKKPYINKFYSNSLNINSLDAVITNKTSNLLINNNIPLNKDLISKPISYKSRIIFYYLKYKVISGMKLQGTGRLTKRLTASRSISKYIAKGSLKDRTSSYNGLSTVVLRGYVKSNLQYVNVNSYNRIGAYGIKSWISSH
jgi:hypothetical protein